MKLTLYRREFSAATIGELFIDNKFCCHTLEPRCIDWTTEKKEWGKTSIPEGVYEVINGYSSKYDMMMPYLDKVPNFKGIMIHPGNFLSDTHGCILVGYRNYKSVTAVYNSRVTFQILKNLIMASLYVNEKVTIEVTSSRPPKEVVVHQKFDELYHDFRRIRYGEK